MPVASTPLQMKNINNYIYILLTIINPYYHIVDFGHTVRHPGHLHKPRHRGAKASTHIEGLQGYISNLYIEWTIEHKYKRWT